MHILNILSSKSYSENIFLLQVKYILYFLVITKLFYIYPDFKKYYHDARIQFSVSSFHDS